jgi:hypothetical protein
MEDVKISPKIYLKGIIEYVDKDVDSRFSQFDSLIKK